MIRFIRFGEERGQIQIKWRWPCCVDYCVASVVLPQSLHITDHVYFLCMLQHQICHPDSNVRMNLHWDRMSSYFLMLVCLLIMPSRDVISPTAKFQVEPPTNIASSFLESPSKRILYVHLQLISTHNLEWNLGCIGCEMISSHLKSRGVLAWSRLNLAEKPETRSRITSSRFGSSFAWKTILHVEYHKLGKSKNFVRSYKRHRFLL